MHRAFIINGSRMRLISRRLASQRTPSSYCRHEGIRSTRKAIGVTESALPLIPNPATCWAPRTVAMVERQWVTDAARNVHARLHQAAAASGAAGYHETRWRTGD